jgi:hypothetical protein
LLGLPPEMLGGCLWLSSLRRVVGRAQTATRTKQLSTKTQAQLCEIHQYSRMGCNHAAVQPAGPFECFASFVTVAYCSGSLWHCTGEAEASRRSICQYNLMTFCMVAFPRIHLRTKFLCRVTLDHGLPMWPPVDGKVSQRVVSWLLSTLQNKGRVACGPRRSRLAMTKRATSAVSPTMQHDARQLQLHYIRTIQPKLGTKATGI